MTRASLTVFVVLVQLAGTAGDASAERGLSVGRAHTTAVPRAATRGIEVGMPRSGPYGRGLALDAMGRWAASRLEFARAIRKYERIARLVPQRARLMRDWIVKARYLLLQSNRLVIHHNSLARAMGGVASRLFDRADAMHQKFLAIRTFWGREPRKLREQILALYRSAIQWSPGNRLAALGRATFLHQIGRHAAAKKQRAQIFGELPRRYAYELARYYAAAGKRKAALAALREALHYHGASVRQAYSSNDFDGLRHDVAFRRLMRRLLAR